MPNNAYFARYESPNITIVPTVSFWTEQIAEPNNTISLTSPILNCEQLTPVTDNIGESSPSPCRSNCNQQNLQVMSSNTSTSAKFSDNFTNSLCVTQDTISTEAPASNMSKSINGLSTSKYKSRNNLVDLTGFNLLKRERDSTSSLAKRKDIRQIDDTKMEQDNMKTSYDENEHRHYSDSDSYKTDNISKESPTSAKPTSTHSEGNTENLANGEPKEIKTDMEVKMKKYFRQLWKRNLDKLKDRAAKEKHDRAIKSSSKTRQAYKDSKQESSRSKATLQKVSKSNSTKDLRNKIIHSSKKYRDLERKCIAKEPKRSKSETNSRHLRDSKVCIRDRKIDLSTDSIKRYKDFQRFIRHNDDHEIKYKSGNQIKTENLPRKKIRMKSCETTTNKPVVKKKVDERKQTLKTEKLGKLNTNDSNLESVDNYTDMERAIDQSKTDKVKQIKSVVRVDRTDQNNLQSKRVRSCTPPAVQDLRSKLSRKRAKSEYFVNCHEPMEYRLDQESLMITVNQDVKADSKNTPILAPTLNKPKPKKCKQEGLMTIVKQDVKADSKNSPISAHNLNKPKPKKCKQEGLMTTVKQDVKADSNNLPISEHNLNKPKPNKCKQEGLMITVKQDVKADSKNSPILASTVNKPKLKKCKQEGLMITVKQDVKADSKNSPILAPTVNKSKPKKCKKIKLVINIECPNSDSDNSDQDFNECCSSPEDLSFLEDFNIDEIVDSLNSQVEPNNTTTTGNEYKNNEQIKPNKGLINNANMKTIEITKKEENSSHKGQVIIEINSDTEDDDMNMEIGSVANTKKFIDEQNMEENSEVDRNTKQEANNITDLTGNGYEENAPKEIIDLCTDEPNIKTNSKVDRNMQEANSETYLYEKYCDKSATKEKMDLSDDINDSVVEVIDITDENEHYMTSKHLQPKKNIQISTLAKKVNKPSVNRRAGSENANKKCHNSQHEDKTHITVEQKSDPTNIIKKKQSQLQKSEDPIEASLQKMFNIEQNKSVDSIGVKSDVIKELNTSDKHAKEKNDNTHNCEDTVEASLEAMFYNCEQNGSISKHIEHNKINNGCDKKATENSIQNSVVEISLESIFNGAKHLNTGIIMDIEQPRLSVQHTRNEIDVLHTPQVMIEVPETINNIVDQKKNLNEIKIELSNVTDNHIVIESESQEPVNQILPEITKNGIEHNAEIKINCELLNVSDITEKYSQKSVSTSKKDIETEENILEKADNKMDIKPLCRSSKNVEKKLQTFEDTVNISEDKPINNIEKKTNNGISSPPSKNEILFDSGNLTKGKLETAESFAENCLTSPQIDIRPQNSLCQNNSPKDEPLQKSVETIKTSSKATIDNGELKTDIRSESNKSVEEKTLLPLENSEVKSEKSSERSNIQHKTNVTTSGELTIPDKNIEVTSRKISISKDEKSLTTNNKESTLSKQSNVENQSISETVKNNTQNLETNVDAITDLNNVTIKDRELGKRSEIVTNTKTKQEQVSTNKSLVLAESKNKDEKKSYKQAAITPQMKPFLSKLESRMSEYLRKKYTFSSVIHSGRFSTIYKCFDNKGETYAVKVVRQRQIGMFMEGMLFLLQQYRSRQNSFILYLMSAFEVQNRWCLLTEYYPKNLKQALNAYTRGFHIDQVQVLSRQLVDAVNMLTNAGVIHSDIKPSHVLLNSAHDRLKLCGFDRANYTTCFNIKLSNGTPSYRAPEVILGFQEDHRIDVWSTALVMFEMATNKTLFMGGSNNGILYQQLCTFGSFDWSMVEQSRFRDSYFSGTSFLREFRYKNSESIVVVHSLQRNGKLRRTLFQSYERQWAWRKSKWQMTKDLDKLESLQKLLEQMLVLDPRNRLPIQFVAASEFMNH